MNLPRLHLFEFCDLPWLPKVWRDLFYQILVCFADATESKNGRRQVLDSFIRQAQVSRIAELGSGNGLNSFPVFEDVLKKHGVMFVLTDLLPQVESYQELRSVYGEDIISFKKESVSFFDLPHDLSVEAIYLDRALHHLKPDEVRKLFSDSTELYGNLLCTEVFERNLWNCFALFISAFIMTFVFMLMPRNISLKGFVWTFVIPVMPLIFTWDSVVSVMRVYTHTELDSLKPEGVKSEFKKYHSVAGVSSYSYMLFS